MSLSSLIYRFYCYSILALMLAPNWVDASDDFEPFAKNISANFPTPYTKRNRVMGFILAYGYEHMDPLIATLNEYVSMCEGGWEPTVVLQTVRNRTEKMMRYMENRMYCYRIGKPVSVRIDLHDPAIGTGLAATHQTILREEIDKFDLFVYHEDDIMFTYPQLVAYLAETKRLHDLDPENGLREHVMGFQRYRRLRRSWEEVYRGDGYGENDIFEQELLEEVPEISLTCIKDQPYQLVTGNTHQAMWVFTADNVRWLQHKCNFMDHESPSREFMSSFLIYEHKAHYCGLYKLHPAERFYKFGVQHYYQQRHVSWFPMWTANENVKAGFHHYSVPKAGLEVPDCWKDIVEESKAAQGSP